MVRSISFLDKHRKSRSDTETILSTPADRRAAAAAAGDLREEVTLPGFVVEQRKSGSLDIDHLSGPFMTRRLSSTRISHFSLFIHLSYIFSASSYKFDPYKFVKFSVVFNHLRWWFDMEWT